MKITFEGETLHQIGDQMVVFLLELNHPFVGRLEAQETLPDAVKAPLVPEEVETAPAPVPHEADRAEAPPPEEPAPKPAKVSKASKPKPKPEEKVEEKEETDPPTEPTSVDLEKARKDAISRLMILYNKAVSGPPKVKTLLKDFGVTKFSEVSDAQVPALMERVVELEKELA